MSASYGRSGPSTDSDTGAAPELNPQTYLWLNTARLDSPPDVVHSDVPDRVHGTAKKGKKGRTVTVRDVLDHKQGDEVWVVINGDVYKWVTTGAFLTPHTLFNESFLVVWLLSCFLLLVLVSCFCCLSFGRRWVAASLPADTSA